MIPCFICGKDASVGWTKGFTPAPDSQKMALCAEHNTPENRLRVIKAWNAMLRDDLSVLNEIAKHKASAPGLHMANVQFTGGGMLSFVCTACTPTEQGTLRIEAPDGTLNYIPMQHVREYSVRPYAKEPKPATPAFPASSEATALQSQEEKESERPALESSASPEPQKPLQSSLKKAISLPAVISDIPGKH